MRKNKFLNLLFIAVLTVVLVLPLCSCGNKNSDKTSADNTDTEVDITKTYDIITQVATLKYPLKWKDTTKTNVVTKDDVTTVEFTATIENKDYHLFDFIFGGEDGDIIGTYTKDGKEFSVYIKTYDTETANVSDEVNEEIRQREEDINVIFENLQKTNNFVF